MRNHILIWTSLFLLIISISSCSKRETTVASGVIYDYYTGEPAKNIKVKIEEYDYLTGYRSNTTVTDDRGYYYLCARFSKRCQVEAYSHDPIYGEQGRTSSPAEVGKANRIDLRVKQDAQFLIKIRNTNPVDSNDQFIFKRRYPSGTYPEVPHILNGLHVDVTFVHPGVANDMNVIEYEVVKNGIKSVFQDSIFVPLDSLPTLVINY